MDVEILAPAGNEQSLQAAFAAGADAVYFALGQFGARAYAKNFSLKQAEEVIQSAHLAGRKVYVTMNTLLEEDQMEAAYEQAKALHELGVDALIIQDLGLIHMLHHRLPELELHASTQLSVSTPYQIEQLRKLGVKRAVLAREATLDEIRACAKTGMELEVFVHGALCISYSGQCRFSQVRYDRSGNKGRCAQACRMEYTLEEDGKPVETEGRFLLSPKDLSLIEQISSLRDAGVISLKIEGRMKSPEYVFESVKAARAAADGKRVTPMMKEGIDIAFNRGYSKGHAYDQRGADLMNPKTSNHQGIPAGEVLSVHHNRAKVRLEHDLHQNDGLRFTWKTFSTGQIANFIFDEKGRLISGAKKGQIVEIKVGDEVRPGMKMRLTSSFVLQKEVEEAIRDVKVQAPITFRLSAAQIGDPLMLEADDGTHSVTIEGPQLEAAKTIQPLEKRNAGIEKALRKTGDTWARVESIQIDLPQNAFVPASLLNQMRRDAIEKLTAFRLERPMVVEVPYDFHPEQPERLPDYAVIMDKSQNIEDDLLSVSEFPIAGTVRKAPIYKDDGEFTDSLGKGKIVENLNLTNSYAVAALLELGYQGGVLAGELTEQGRKDLMRAFKERYGFDAPVVLTAYEKPRLMIMKHCPVNTAKKDGRRENCSLCRVHRYTLRGKDGKRAILLGNPDCRMQLFDEVPVNRIGEIGEFEKEGIHAFRAVFSDENAQQAKTIRKELLDAIQGADSAAKTEA